MKNLHFRNYLRTGLLAVAGLIFAFSSYAQTPIEVTCDNQDVDINGIALISNTKDETQFLIVIDYGAALLTVNAGGAPTCKKLTWKGKTSGPEKQLEALTAIPGADRKNEFLALREDGVIYHIRYTPGNAEIIGDPFNVPDKPAWADDFEGLAVQIVNGQMVIAWSQRGDDSPGKIFWSKFKINASDPGERFEGAGEVDAKGKPLMGKDETINVPYPKLSEVRHISDLKIDTLGAVFIVSTSDTEDSLTSKSKDFPSAFYFAGIFSNTAGKIDFKETNSYTPLKRFEKQKVEALELVPGEFGGVAFAADNEIRTRGKATLIFKYEACPDQLPKPKT